MQASINLQAKSSLKHHNRNLGHLLSDQSMALKYAAKITLMQVILLSEEPDWDNKTLDYKQILY